MQKLELFKKITMLYTGILLVLTMVNAVNININQPKNTTYVGRTLDLKFTVTGGTNNYECSHVLCESNSSQVGFWRLDENTSSTVIDDSNSGNNGTIKNGAVYVDGKWKTALSFDGVDDYVNISDDSSFNFTDENAFTISAWIYPKNRSSYAGIVSKGHWGIPNSEKTYEVRLYGGSVICSINTDGSNNYYDTISISNDAWQFITCRYNGSYVEIFKNAISSGTPTQVSGTLNSNTRDLLIGSHYYAGEGSVNQYFNGSIDEVRIWSRALSNSEIENLYDSYTYYTVTNNTSTSKTLTRLADESSQSVWVECRENQTTYTKMFLNTTLFYNQYAVNITNCSSLTTTKAIDFNIYDESDKTNVVATLEAAFDIYNSTGGLERQYSFVMYGDDNYSICVYPTWESFITDAHIQYYNRTTYPDRTYFLDDATLSNSTTTIDLYSIKDTDSESVTITVKNPDGSVVEGAYVYAQRFYVSENSYITTSITRTDTEGKANMYLAPNDIWYKFLVYKDGVLEKITDPMTIKSTEIVITLEGSSYLEFFDYYGKVSTSCSFNDTSGILSCTATDTSGLLHQTCLKVQRVDPLVDNVTCDYCSSYNTSSITMTCTLGNITGQVWSYSFYGTFNDTSIFISDILDYTIAEEKPYGSGGLIAASLIIMTVSTVGLWSPPVAIVLGLVSLTIASVIGLVVLEISAWISIVVVGIILILKLRS